ncbi:MAG: LPS export ABC transporter periplasmic protein LptC [Burkholderiaceae bacterium]
MRSALGLLREAWDRASIYLPLVLMGLLALGSYWLVRNAPIFDAPQAQRPARHEPDYFMRGFGVKTFDAAGRLKSEVLGTEARHFPDTDTLEIDKARLRTISPEGRLTTASADRALSNADGSEVQLFGNAVVVRDAASDPSGKPLPRLEFRGEFLHAFLNSERVKSHKPVVLLRGQDQFTADAMDYDNLDRVMDMRGRVKGLLIPRPAQSPP